MSPRLWIYFVIMIPVTVCVVGAWFWWDRRQERKYGLQDRGVEYIMYEMENRITEGMKNRNRTWE